MSGRSFGQMTNSYSLSGMTATSAQSHVMGAAAAAIPSPGITPGQFKAGGYFSSPVTRPAAMAGSTQTTSVLVRESPAGYLATLQGKNAWDALVHGMM
jgi:hypothetical protein